MENIEKCDKEISEIEERPFYYEKSLSDNNISYYIVKNTNYEEHRFKTSYLKLTHNDLKVSGTFIYLYAPLKRKISKNNLNKNSSGRNIYRYDKKYSNIFYLNNKLKITECITNRYVVFNKLTFYSNNKSENIYDDKNCGIRIESIISSILQISEKFIPPRIYTNNPIVCELMLFIMSKYLKPNMFRNITSQARISIYYIKNIQNISKLQNNIKYRFKTRSCLINNRNENDNISSSLLYTFTDQSIIIVDNNYNDEKFPKIIINIPQNSISKKEDFFINPNHEIMKSISKGFSYFSL